MKYIVFELSNLSADYGLYWYNYYIQLNQIGALKCQIKKF